MTIYIKNMVCHRCILVVQQMLDKLQIPYKGIALGEVELDHPLEPEKKEQLEDALLVVGFSLIDDRKRRLIEQIKTIVVKMVHQDSGPDKKQNISDYLSDQLHYDYNYLSNLFSSVEGTTIEQYVIQQKIERVKELLVYDELTLSSIAAQMGYSSVAHLSNQFKKVTGLSPSFFKQLKENKRRPLDEL